MLPSSLCRTNRVTEQPPINRPCWASGPIALVLVSVIFASAGCGADADPIAERTDLPEVCRVPGKWLTLVGPGNHALAGEAARLGLVGDSRQNYWLLHPSDCALQSVKLPSPVTMWPTSRPVARGPAQEIPS